jgi:hypothetical protein
MAAIPQIEQQIQKVQSQALETLTATQQRLLDVNVKVAEVVKDRVGAVKVPFAAALPQPAEGIKMYFDFAGKVMAANRSFAERAVAAWTQPTPAPKATASKATAPKATAPKATAPKATAPKATGAKTARPRARASA